MQKNNKNILIGMAWPYANGSLHLGHIAGLLPADVLARYHRIRQNRVLFVSGSDCHGTPISVKARQENKQPEEIAERYHQEFSNNFAELGFSFDYYGQTKAPEHADQVQKIFLELYEKKLIYKRTQELTYCPKCEEFLPDRYVEGICPKCGSKNARGDQCDDCGSLLDPQELVDPKCKTCGTTPENKESEHFFLKLSAFENDLKKWLAKQTTWRANALNFTKNFIDSGLKDRAITRDIDWGISIPLEGYEDKKIYVWFEAVCGYFSDSIIWGKENNQDIKQWWDKDSDSWHYYVHGKDNIPFHSIIWPSILMGFNKHLPNQIVSSEYLSLEGKQLSTSRNWAVWLPNYLEKFTADPLRYYLIINGPENSDADFSWSQFIDRNNNELVGTYGNLVNRVFGFVIKNFDGNLKTCEVNSEIRQKITETYQKSDKLIEQAKFRGALQEIFSLAKFANQYLDQTAPWKSFKNEPEACAKDLFQALTIIQNLAVLLLPFLPFSSTKLLASFDIKSAETSWYFTELNKHQNLEKPDILFEKLDPEIVEQQKARLG